MAKAHPIESLAAKATTQTLQASAKQSLVTAPSITGQYLFERFVTESKEDVTKIDLVQQAVSACDTATWKAALKDMVKIAKDTGSEAKLRTASNYQSVLRSVYGALKFAADEMAAAGFVAGRTGYHEARVMAKKALDTKAITWEGYANKTADEREKERLDKMQRKVLRDVQDANPQQAGEDLGAYLDRIRATAEKALADKQAEHMAERVVTLARKVIELCGADLDAVIAAIPEVQAATAEAAQTE